MPILPTILSTEISDKYTIVSNAFRLAKLENPKDIIVTEIGDTKQTEFYPQVKIGRWGDDENTNEVNFSVRLKDTEYEKATVSTLKDKIVWEKGNITAHFYPLTEGEGGFKFVWYLKKKPATNKVEFTIQSKGLDFFYQPELTAEEIAQGAFRPENVVGSYAVYHSTKGGMNDANGKDYKVGKAFHIYRPHLIDANGLEAWGNLHIENGIYSVEIPQEFLDKAVYPIKSNDTFGSGSTGESTEDLAVANFRYGEEAQFYEYFSGSGYQPGVNGIVSSITLYSGGYYDSELNEDAEVDITAVLYENLSQPLDLVASKENTTVSYELGWKTFTFSSPPTIEDTKTYWIGAIGDSHDLPTPSSGHWYFISIHYDEQGDYCPELYWSDSPSSYSIPDPLTGEGEPEWSPPDSWEISTEYGEEDQVENDGVYYWALQNHTSSADDEPGVGINWETYWAVIDYWKKFSIYATYTPAAGPANVKSVNGVAMASVKSVNTVVKASIKSINGIT